ncbi:hypothetical protein [Streptomyces yatensis]|uniref:Uncharacterized protein n=1 Tax=Streptomyces yatensis TaxID=155177 RepID=A0ABN2INC8_9ACTN|nr:hypothetical protein [Streptomyces yatensis]
MADTPHITIGHRPLVGVVAAPSHDHHVTDHLLRRVGFEPVPDSRLYTLTERDRDPVRRTQLAVQSLRAARQSVTADAAYDLHPGERLPPPLAPEAEFVRQTTAAAQRRAQAALTASPARIQTVSALPPSAVEHAFRPAPARALQAAHTR